MNSAGSEDRWVQPEWWGPPEGWFGGVLPVAPVVGRNSRGAIFVDNLTVYPSGLAFDLQVILRPRPAPTLEDVRPTAPPGDDPVPDTPLSLSVYTVRVEDEDWEAPVNVTERVRFGAEFRDGRRAASGAPVGGPGGFTILEFQEGKPVAPDPEVNMVLHSTGGSSGPEFMRSRYFLWPLPVDGVRFFGSWPDVLLEEDSVELDSATIADGLARARSFRPCHRDSARPKEVPDERPFTAGGKAKSDRLSGCDGR
jgi:hypothetical protein